MNSAKVLHGLLRGSDKRYFLVVESELAEELNNGILLQLQFDLRGFFDGQSAAAVLEYHGAGALKLKPPPEGSDLYSALRKSRAAQGTLNVQLWSTSGPEGISFSLVDANIVPSFGSGAADDGDAVCAAAEVGLMCCGCCACKGGRCAQYTNPMP